MRNDNTMRIARTTLLGLAGLGAAGWLSASLMAGTPRAARGAGHSVSHERTISQIAGREGTE